QQRRHQSPGPILTARRRTRAPSRWRPGAPRRSPGPHRHPRRIPGRIPDRRPHRRPYPHHGGTMIRLRPLATTAAAALALGCADTNAPLPDPTEVLLVVNSTANTLSIVPVENTGQVVSVPLGGTTPTPV